MSPLIATGLVCGLASAVVSEAVLRLDAGMLKRRLMHALAVGIGLRTLWVLTLAAWALSGGVANPPAFVLALLLGYLFAQVFEGVRYERYFERC